VAMFRGDFAGARAHRRGSGSRAEIGGRGRLGAVGRTDLQVDPRLTAAGQR
jgi:hypothetical protein